MLVNTIVINKIICTMTTTFHLKILIFSLTFHIPLLKKKTIQNYTDTSTTIVLLKMCPLFAVSVFREMAFDPFIDYTRSTNNYQDECGSQTGNQIQQTEVGTEQNDH